MGRKFTDEDTKEFLRSIQYFVNLNQDVFSQIMELRAIAESCTIQTDKENVQSSGSGDKMANIVGKIVDLERELYQRNKIIKHRRAKFEEVTKQMGNDKEVQFLTFRYYDGMGFYDTALMMDLSDSSAKKIHKKAVSEFTKIFNKTR